MSKPVLGQGEAVCLGCRFWHAGGVPTIETAGLCRRHAPEPRLAEPRQMQGVLRGQWPVTEASDWCGQWEEETIA